MNSAVKLCLATGIALQICMAGPMVAQAWVAPKGETTLFLTFQRSEFPGHLLDRGEKDPIGDSYSRTLNLELEYSVSDRFAIAVGIPYAATKNGEDPSPVAGRTGIDDGQWHSTWQDWRLTARYNILSDPIVLTPFVRLVIPSHRYETRAEAAPGRDLNELIFGLNAGRLLTVIPNAYVHAQIAYAFVDELEGVSTDRINGSLSLGYFLTPALSLSVSGIFQNTYGGLSVDYLFNPEGLPNPDVPAVEFFEHDRLLAEDNVRLGVGASYALGPSWSVNAGYATVVDGSATHYGDTYVMGLQWIVSAAR